MSDHILNATIEKGWLNLTLECHAEGPEPACHKWVDGGETGVSEECCAVAWIENDDIENAYAGGPTPLRSGPVDVRWSRSAWRWEYSAETKIAALKTIEEAP